MPEVESDAYMEGQITSSVFMLLFSLVRNDRDSSSEIDAAFKTFILDIMSRAGVGDALEEEEGEEEEGESGAQMRAYIENLKVWDFVTNHLFGSERKMHRKVLSVCLAYPRSLADIVRGMFDAVCPVEEYRDFLGDVANDIKEGLVTVNAEDKILAQIDFVGELLHILSPDTPFSLRRLDGLLSEQQMIEAILFSLGYLRGVEDDALQDFKFIIENLRRVMEFCMEILEEKHRPTFVRVVQATEDEDEDEEDFDACSLM